MKNAILLSLTNRRTGFLSPAFQNLPDFTPAAESPEEKEVRDILDLRPGDSDYAVKGLLGTVDAFPSIRARFGETERSWRPSDFSRLDDNITGASLVADPVKLPTIARVPMNWPVDTRMRIYGDLSEARMTIDGHSYVTSCHTDGRLLAVDWPDASGISGRIHLLDESATSYDIQIDHEPVAYPFDSIVRALEASAAARRLLIGQGLNKAWYASDSAAEKVAIMALALGLSNRTVYA